MREQTKRIAVEAVQIHALWSADTRRTKRSIAAELNVHEATVSRVLREIREGRRDPATGKLLRGGL